MKKNLEQMLVTYVWRLGIERELFANSYTTEGPYGKQTRLYQGKVAVLERAIEDLRFLLDLEMEEDGWAFSRP